MYYSAAEMPWPTHLVLQMYENMMVLYRHYDFIVSFIDNKT